MLQIYVFLPSVVKLGFLLFDKGAGTLPQVVLGFCATQGGRPPGTHRVAGYHSVEDLGLLLLVGRVGTLPQADMMGNIGFCAPWRDRPPVPPTE
jgi:hypothetical protein